MAVIGDQIFTDIYGGNKVNMLTVLVKPIDKKEILYVRLKRHIEKRVLKRFSNVETSRLEVRNEWKKKRLQIEKSRLK